MERNRKNRNIIMVSALFLLCILPVNAQSEEIFRLNSGSSIQDVVNNSPEGAIFYLEPGVYRLQRVVPKDGQKFIGQPGVIFNGALLLGGWQREGNFWVAAVPEKRFGLQGYCHGGGDLCKHREDLFVNNVVYHRSESLDDLASRKWYERKWYDDGAKIYLVDDPTGKTVELSVTSNAFISKASDVVLKDIVVEKYASAAQRGAIEFAGGKGWLLINVVARWNHGVGARIGGGTQITGGSYSHNGQLGLGGGFGTGIVIDGAEIAYNNYAGFSAGWEAGGTKFVKANGLVVRNSCVHHNIGPGLWTDIDNINIVFSGNKVFDNAGAGIKHEISYKAAIRDNVVSNNGSGYDIWFWGSQILVQNSRDVQVFGNTVQIAATYGNGISIVQQKRGDGEFGPRISINNNIHNNLIIHLGRQGMNGMAADYEREEFYQEGNNKYDSNTYVVPKPETKYVEVESRLQSWDELRKKGYEVNGKVQIERRLPLQLSCDS